MKKLNYLSLVSFCFLLFVSFNATAQKISVNKGKLSALKGVKSYHVEFTYEDMKVGKKSEKSYISENVKKKNKEEKGSGDAWLEAWKGNRASRFEPKFVELFNKTSENREVSLDEGDVKMMVHITNTDPGWNVGVMRRPCFVNLEIEFVKSGKTVCKMTMDRIPGADAMGFDFDAAYRIQEGYAKGGKALAKYMKKKIK